MVRQRGGFGDEILKRWPLDVFVFALTAIAGIKVIFKERSEVDLFKRIFLVRRRRRFFGGRQALAFFLAAPHIVDEGDCIFQFLQNRILNHFLSNHVLELKLVEREDADHLHEARCEDLPL